MPRVETTRRVVFTRGGGVAGKHCSPSAVFVGSHEFGASGPGGDEKKTSNVSVAAL